MFLSELLLLAYCFHSNTQSVAPSLSHFKNSNGHMTRKNYFALSATIDHTKEVYLNSTAASNSSPQLPIYSKFAVKFGDFLEIRLEMFVRVLDIVDRAHLPDAVHRQLRRPNIDGADANAAREDRVDRRAAGHVVEDGQPAPLADLPERERCVPLVRVVLDQEASVHHRLVVLLVLVRVVGVQSVRHVCRGQEAPLNRLLEETGARWVKEHCDS